MWLAILLAGMVRDGFMALFMTMIFESEGVGTGIVGTATGFAMVFSAYLGSLLAPPIGNSLAAHGPGLPFAFGPFWRPWAFWRGSAWQKSGKVRCAYPEGQRPALI